MIQMHIVAAKFGQIGSDPDPYLFFKSWHMFLSFIRFNFQVLIHSESQYTSPSFSNQFPEPSSWIIHTSMLCLTSSDCEFDNPLLPESLPDIFKAIQDSDSLISQILHRSQPLLGPDYAPINDKIVKLERLESWYKTQLHAVQKSLKDCKSVFAPVRCLPHDILLEIFHSACDCWWEKNGGVEHDRLVCSTPDSLDMAGPLWVLSSICRIWRDVLHTSPASWARWLFVKSPFSKHTRQILQTYLKCTGKHPLSLAAFCNSPDLVAEDGEIMSLLIQSCHRWKNVCIRIDVHHTHHLQSILHLPILQTIELDITGHGHDDLDDYMCFNAPHLWQANLGQGIHRVRLPSGITHLSGYISCAEDLQVLPQLPNLRTLHLLPIWHLSSTGMTPVVMAELRQLYVAESDTLDFLMALMLQSLTIFDFDEGSSSVAPSCFLHRSGCCLKSLGVSSHGSLTLISNLLSSEACSMISHLKLDLKKSWDGISKILTSSSILPNLCHLVLVMPTEPLFFHKKGRLALLNMVCSCCKAGTLKRIVTCFVIPCHTIEAEFRAVIGDKVEMQVKGYSSLFLDYWHTFWGTKLPY
ncbi:hypothetical protein EDD18DRAFT_1413410 [Armillaria luteobubalina]|uniref:F-box domain-containing protein n=1 Tax=Armillaria luteobubalina TaxID=153913 RepID=A0AA39UKY6_9AGAR|nr:hypothetical protein EDD18DRAFT_1413410 [Armillaria luteobubalina]